MRMPILLSGHTMTPAGALRPQSFQLSMRTDGLSSGTLVLDPDNPEVIVGSWIQVWAPNGEMCVMYVKNRKKDYVTGNVTLTLEHTFGLLQGMVVFGEVTPETMSGTTGAETCTVSQAITYLLGQQAENLWTMANGDCDFTDAQGWKFTNSDIYNDLNSLTDAIEDCQWEFDQSVFPWKLKLKEWPTASTMELRRNRNLDTMNVTLDRSGMYTRVYPTGKNNLHIDSVNNNIPYLDRHTSTYGVIANVITDSTIKDPNLLKAWAKKQLKRNSVPKVSVTISGYELSQATGESMDKLITGRLCRIPLPEYGETVTERLIELSWRDCIAQPDAVTCTLANELKTITGVLNERARGGGGGGKKNNTEHDCELEKDEDKIEMFENSDIWINRDSIWAVCGQYEVVTHPDGSKELIVVEGTALKLRREGTEWGVYDEGKLTGGIMIQKINDETVLTISADRIDIQGVVNSLSAYDIEVRSLNVLVNCEIIGYLDVGQRIATTGTVQAGTVDTDVLIVDGTTYTYHTKGVVTDVQPHYYGTYQLATTADGSTVNGYVQMTPMSYITVSYDTIHYLGT
jgi:phage minor structural protein